MLGLEAQLGPTEHPCPSCADATTLMAIELEEYRLEECAACTGVFVEHLVLERISRRTDAERGVRARPAPKSTIDATAPVRYRKCPLCADVMTRRNFGDRSGVIVDICARHGVWFDSDELTRILEFVAGGGVAAGAVDAAAQKERAERIKRRMAAVSRDPGTLADDESTGLFVDIAATLTDFIKWY
jgi:Zn-finger nucleic acid-binding protein